jgi:hypothetical protein
MDYGYSNGMGVGATVIVWLFSLAIGIFMIVANWKVFEKAGKPGWAVLIPVYNIYVYLQILGRPWWWLLLLLFVPFANIVIGIIMIFDLAKVFGKDTGFGFGLLFLSVIFIPILAFGDATYHGPIINQ